MPCRCTFDDIPTISVARIYDKWFSADNRRLWVAKQLERLGKLDRIHVKVVGFIPRNKLTSNNGGVDIRVRRNPGGRWYSKAGAAWQVRDDTTTRRTSRDHYNVCVYLICLINQ